MQANTGRALGSRDVGQGPALLLLHGLGGSGRAWSGVVRQLRDRYRLLSIDLPGHGESPAVAAGEDVGVAAIAARVRATADGLGVAHPILVGHSIGGFVALDLALGGYGRGLALVASEAGRTTLPWLDDVPRYRAIAAQGGMEAVFEVLAVEDPALRDALERRPEDRAAFAQVFRQLAPASYLAIAEAMARRPDRTAELSRLAVPTLAIVGSRDTPFLPAARAFAERTGGALEVIADAGHLPMLEQPAAVAAALDRFAAAIGGAA